jgi:hypothetical protein
MEGKIEGRSPEAFGLRENVEKDLSDHKDHEFTFQLNLDLFFFVNEQR